MTSRLLRWLQFLAGIFAGLTLFLTACPGQALAAGPSVAVSEEDLFIIPAPVVQKVEYIDQWTITNASATPQPVVFHLPSGAANVSVNGQDVSPSSIHNGTLTLPQKAAPGKQTKATIVWVLPLSSQKDVQFNLYTDYPIYVAHVYLPIGNSALSAEGLLTTTETVQISGTTFREFTRPGINRGDDWTLSVQMLPDASTTPSLHGMKVIGSHPGDLGQTAEAVGNLLVVAVILAVGLFSIRATQWGRMDRRRKSWREALLDALVNVQRQYDVGMLDSGEFQRRKDQLMQKLATLRESD